MTPERSAYFRERYRKNREAILAYNKAWNKANKDKMNAIVRRYRAKWTKDEWNKYERSYYKRDPHRHVERQQRYYTRHRAKVLIKVAERYARSLQAVGICSAEQWMARVEYWGWRCRYCNVELTPRTLTIDHSIPLSRGGTQWSSNLVPACIKCNVSKGHTTPKEFYVRKQRELDKRRDLPAARKRGRSGKRIVAD